jgi:sRNA-binding carbon storage regulator CsrA
MLVVSLKEDEFAAIRLPDGTSVAIQLTKIQTDKVRIGIVAPRAVRVLRGSLVAKETGRSPEELLAQIKEQCRE